MLYTMLAGSDHYDEFNFSAFLVNSGDFAVQLLFCQQN